MSLEGISDEYIEHLKKKLYEKEDPWAELFRFLKSTGGKSTDVKHQIIEKARELGILKHGVRTPRDFWKRVDDYETASLSEGRSSRGHRLTLRRLARQQASNRR